MKVLVCFFQFVWLTWHLFVASGKHLLLFLDGLQRVLLVLVHLFLILNCLAAHSCISDLTDFIREIATVYRFKLLFTPSHALIICSYIYWGLGDFVFLGWFRIEVFFPFNLILMLAGVGVHCSVSKVTHLKLSVHIMLCDSLQGRWLTERIGFNDVIFFVLPDGVSFIEHVRHLVNHVLLRSSTTSGHTSSDTPTWNCRCHITTGRSNT